MREIPIPEDSSEKEVYAFFGLAAYCGQVLEQGLLLMAVTLNVSGKTAITRKIIDSLFQNLDLRTFGQLLSETNKLIKVPDDLSKSLELARKKRNHLVHSFFEHHSKNFMSDAGRSEMIEELRSMVSLFQSVDEELDKIYLPLAAKLGITQERIEHEMETMMASALERDGTS